MIHGLNYEQTNFACQMVSLWIRTCEENNRGTGEADAQHSALLRRLLSGGKLHDKPPPLRMSYPAWELVEEEVIKIIEFKDRNGDIRIDQHPGYIWVDEKNSIIEYPRLGIKYHYYEEPVEETLPNGTKMSYINKFLRRLHD